MSVLTVNRLGPRTLYSNFAKIQEHPPLTKLWKVKVA